MVNRQHNLVARKASSTLAFVNKNKERRSRKGTILLWSYWICETAHRHRSQFETPRTEQTSGRKPTGIGTVVLSQALDWSEEHLACEERLRCWDLFSWDKRWLWGGRGTEEQPACTPVSVGWQEDGVRILLCNIERIRNKKHVLKQRVRLHVMEVFPPPSGQGRNGEGLPKGLYRLNPSRFSRP